jgi:hypothetical protein
MSPVVSVFALVTVVAAFAVACSSSSSGGASNSSGSGGGGATQYVAFTKPVSCKSDDDCTTALGASGYTCMSVVGRTAGMCVTGDWGCGRDTCTPTSTMCCSGSFIGYGDPKHPYDVCIARPGEFGATCL